MWWFSAFVRAARGRGALAALLLGAGFGLSGCGFEPLYARSGDGGAAPSDEMASIQIVPLADRAGQLMHNLLRDRLNPRGQPRSPRFVLEVSLTEVREELGIRKDETATRANLILSATFVLRDAQTNDILVSGVSNSTNSFNILDDQFATLFAENDARERALRDVSEDIRTRLGMYFVGSRDQAS